MLRLHWLHLHIFKHFHILVTFAHCSSTYQVRKIQLSLKIAICKLRVKYGIVCDHSVVSNKHFLPLPRLFKEWIPLIQRIKYIRLHPLEISYKMGRGWEACTTPTSSFRTLRLTCLGLSTNFASCILVVGLVRRIFKWLLN